MKDIRAHMSDAAILVTFIDSCQADHPGYCAELRDAIIGRELAALERETLTAFIQDCTNTKEL